MTTALALVASLGLATGVTGCGPAVDAGSSMDGSSGTSNGTSSGPTSGVQTSAPGATTTPPPVTTVGSDDTGSAGSTSFIGSSGGSEDSTSFGDFITDPDGGGGVYGVECSLWDQDCARGNKCVPWANDGSDVWNATICRPIDPEGQAAGEPCVVEGSAVSGADDCDANSYCFDVDPGTLEGTCVAFCEGPEVTASCADPNQACVIENEGSVTFCLDSCDPFGVECGMGRSCVAARPGTFVCVRPGETPLGENCSQFTDCGPGASCFGDDDDDAICTSPCAPPGGVCDSEGACVPWGDAGVCAPDEP